MTVAQGFGRGGLSLLAIVGFFSLNGCVTAESSVGAQLAALGSEVCGTYSAPLLAGQTLDSGSVIVSNTGSDFVVGLHANTVDGWQIDQLHVYAGTDPIPTNNAGTPAPGQFPYAQTFESPVTEYTLVVPLEEIFPEGPGCGQTLNVAVHTATSRVDEAGEIVQSETAWAHGENEFDSNRWGWWFTYTLCCDVAEAQGCTLTQGYWRTHHQDAKNAALQIDWPEPLDESGFLCEADERSYLELLHESPQQGDAYLILAHQTIAAELNVASGASTTEEVESALYEAASLLTNHCGQYVAASSELGQQMVIYAGVLDDYNNGLIGPGHCE